MSRRECSADLGPLPSNAEVLAELRGIRAEQARAAHLLEQLLAERVGQAQLPPPAPELEPELEPVQPPVHRLVRALGNAFGRTPFLACEAWEAALQEGELRAVMSELAINGPKSLGHRLRRLEVESAGIGRGSRDHNSVLWVVL